MARTCSAAPTSSGWPSSSARIEGRFILSINDTPGVRETFAAFRMVEVETTYTLAQGAGKKAGELVISNFDLPGTLPRSSGT